MPESADAAASVAEPIPEIGFGDGWRPRKMASKTVAASAAAGRTMRHVQVGRPVVSGRTLMELLG